MNGIFTVMDIYIYDNGNMDNGNTVSDIHGKIPQG
jgi:hypothetical protein